MRSMLGVAFNGVATRRFELVWQRIEHLREAWTALRQLPVLDFMQMNMAADPDHALSDSYHWLPDSAMGGKIGALRIAPEPAGAAIPLPATPCQNGTERKSGLTVEVRIVSGRTERTAFCRDIYDCYMFVLNFDEIPSDGVKIEDVYE